MAEAPAARSAAGTAAQRTDTRPKREREQEVLVWPDLVFVEFISAVVFMIALVALSTLVNAPLLDRANPSVTPNPAKAPWYFLNLQELLLHMHPALAGVVVPTIWLIVLAAIPYFDRSTEQAGVWFGTKYSVRISLFAAVYATIGTIALVLFDAGRIEPVTRWFPCMDGNGIFALRAFQTQCSFEVAGYQWPTDFSKISLGFISGDWNPVFQQISLPAILIEQLIPTLTMVVLPLVQAMVLWKMGWAKTRRDHMLALFSGFIAAFFVMTIIGTAYRGHGMELLSAGEVIRESYEAAQAEIP